MATSSPWYLIDPGLPSSRVDLTPEYVEFTLSPTTRKTRVVTTLGGQKIVKVGPSVPGSFSLPCWVKGITNRNLIAALWASGRKLQLHVGDGTVYTFVPADGEISFALQALAGQATNPRYKCTLKAELI